jgi:hypothetical protein
LAALNNLSDPALFIPQQSPNQLAGTLTDNDGSPVCATDSAPTQVQHIITTTSAYLSAAAKSSQFFLASFTNEAGSSRRSAAILADPVVILIRSGVR